MRTLRYINELIAEVGLAPSGKPDLTKGKGKRGARQFGPSIEEQPPRSNHRNNNLALRIIRLATTK